MADLKEKTYRYVVEFDKLLTRGSINGLTVRDRLHFATENEAKNWIDDIQKIDKNRQYKHFKIKGAV
jgi:hypothetical protein